MRCLAPVLWFLLVLPAVADDANGERTADQVPDARWDHRAEGEDWSRAAIVALKDHGDELVESAPRDVGRFCPGYLAADDAERRAFWVGFLSALAKYESTWKPRAVGGGGQWYGLLQILPATAREFGCRARSGSALLDGAANLSCAIRIMAETVPRDGAIHGDGTEGVAADWGPLKSDPKRTEMRDWLRSQDYCQFDEVRRPRPRPERLASSGSSRESGGESASREVATRDDAADGID